MMAQALTAVTRLSDYKIPDYLIDKVDLVFNLGEEVTDVTSTLTIHANPACQALPSHLVLVGEALTLISVSLNQKKLVPSQFHVTDSELTIFNVPPSFTLTIHTQIKPQENTALSGLYKSSGNFCTQCEAQGFRRITYFLDRPDVMARYTTTIIADEKKYPILLSNGNLIATGQEEQGKHWAKWEDPFKKPCYLFALVAGNLEFIEDHFITQSGRRVTLRIFVEKGNSDKCQHAMQAVKKAMRWDEETFGREYDLDIYMIVAVSDFNMGAMENKGLNIFNTQYILARPETATDMDFIHVESVIAHEYFHNWTGNRITCRDWFQLSLKEGLTIFRDQSFTADTTSRTVARIHDVNDLRQTQFPEDAGPLAHPVRPDSYIEINNFYTATIYNKGAEVIRMMQTLLGEKAFRKGMDLYFNTNDGQAVTIEEFVTAMEHASQVDLTQFRLWYHQAGTPCLEVRDHYDSQQKIYTLTIHQSCLPTPDEPQKRPLHVPLKMGLLDHSGKEICQDVLHVTQSENVFHFNNIPAKPVPSLLRGFSAPVKINYHYSDEALQLLCKHDSDLFNRWEASQRYAVKIILQLIADYRAKKALIVPPGFIDIFQYWLHSSQTDKLLLAEIFNLPSEKYLAEQMDVIDVEAIHVAREHVLLEIATQLKNDFLTVYQQNQTDCSTVFNMEEMGKRQLKNLCLSYLTLLNDKNINEEIILRQLRDNLKNNMTNTLGALRCLVNTDCPERAVALTEFYGAWQHDALVMDKWLALQATSKLPDTLANVKKLLRHPVFDIKNPNKVYALIGAFGQRNPIFFHANDGSGYEFLKERIIELNALNPQVAARMIKPLVNWKQYDDKRQQLMRQQLMDIAAEKNISKDVYELVSKSLQN